MEFLTQDSWKNFICSFFDNAFLLIKSAELIHQLCEIGFENCLGLEVRLQKFIKRLFDFFWNGSDDKWRFYQGRYHGLDALKDAAKDALKDAPDDSSVVEENQVIEDVDRRDACKECTNALSFYRSQNVLCRSKFFEPAQKFDCI